MTDMLKNWINIFTEKELWNILNRVRIVKIKPNIEALLTANKGSTAWNERAKKFAGKYAGKIKIAIPVYDNGWEICDDDSIRLEDSFLDVLTGEEEIKVVSKLEVLNKHFEVLDI